jgi:prepilin-type N-terminal cleavage/methylation domain-containing protein
MKLTPILNRESGVTLIEIIVVVAIITIFSSVLISDFPSIERNFYLSRAASTLAEDLRRAENLSLSGSFLPNGHKISGYGVYITNDDNNFSSTGANSHIYILYADSCQPPNPINTCPSPNFYCQFTPRNTTGCLNGDDIVSTVDLSNIGKDVYVEGFVNVVGNNSTSIDFTPPNPQTTIANLTPGQHQIGIILGLTSDHSKTKEIDVNSAGFINVK